jgi:Ca-activated chloride channel homolog
MSLFIKRLKAARSIRICALLVAAVAALAQEKSPQLQSAAQQPAVKLNVLVLDEAKRAVGGLSQQDFQIMEDGVPQKLSFFAQEDVPLLYGLVVDNSGSLRAQFERIIDAGQSIVAANKPVDETFIARFVDSTKIENVQDFTSDKQALSRKLDKMFIEGGQTALVDAVLLSAKYVAQHKKGDGSANYRRALIVLTDGEDRDSYNRLETLTDFLRLNNLQIFIIGFTEKLATYGSPVSKSPRGRAMLLLNRIAEETGGRVFYPKSSKELPAIVDEMMRDLRTQYIVGYTPAVNPKSKSYREVQVTVAEAQGRGKLTALTRAGYTAPDK